jgi:hypothetical protein
MVRQAQRRRLLRPRLLVEQRRRGNQAEPAGQAREQLPAG